MSGCRAAVETFYLAGEAEFSKKNERTILLSRYLNEINFSLLDRSPDPPSKKLDFRVPWNMFRVNIQSLIGGGGSSFLDGCIQYWRQPDFCVGTFAPVWRVPTVGQACGTKHLWHFRVQSFVKWRHRVKLSVAGCQSWTIFKGQCLTKKINNVHLLEAFNFSISGYFSRPFKPPVYLRKN